VPEAREHLRDRETHSLIGARSNPTATARLHSPLYRECSTLHNLIAAYLWTTA